MSKAKILIVENEEKLAKHIAGSLRNIGHEVCGMVRTEKDALQFAEEGCPDLVLIDTALQGETDGISVAETMRRRFQIPIVYLMAHADDKIYERARMTEPCGYLIKPFLERDLYLTISMALSKHQLHEELQKSQEWLAVTLENIGDGVIAMDTEGRVMLMNPMAESLTGFKQDEVMHRPLGEIFNCITKKGILSIKGFHLCAETNQGFLQPCYDSGILLSRDGRRLIFESSCAPIRNGRKQEIGAALVFRDTTERYRVEERLKLLSEAIEQSTEGIIVLDSFGSIVFVNKAFASLHGFSREELVGSHISVFYSAEQMEEVRAANEQLQRVGQFSGEFLHMRKDGSVFPGYMQSSLLRDEEGNTIGLIGTLRDISDLKAHEEALKGSHEALAFYSATLEAKVEARTRDLQQARRELEKRLESLEKGNKALKIIIEAVEEQKKQVEQKISKNLNLTVAPILEQLKCEEVSDTARFLLQSLDFSLANLFSSFGFSLLQDGNPLTPKETRICEMIRAGLSSKHIAKVMEISPQTVLVHRKNIRKKLGMSKTGKNLASFLKTRG